MGLDFIGGVSGGGMRSIFGKMGGFFQKFSNFFQVFTKKSLQKLKFLLKNSKILVGFGGNSGVWWGQINWWGAGGGWATENLGVGGPHQPHPTRW